MEIGKGNKSNLLIIRGIIFFGSWVSGRQKWAGGNGQE